MIKKERKSEIIAKFAANVNDSGSTAVQIALLTERIEQISKHLQEFKKDEHSRFGLIKLVGQKRRLCSYMKRKNPAEYEKLMKTLRTQVSA